MIFFPGRVKQNKGVRLSEFGLTEETAADLRLKRQDKVSVWNVARTIRQRTWLCTKLFYALTPPGGRRR